MHTPPSLHHRTAQPIAQMQCKLDRTSLMAIWFMLEGTSAIGSASPACCWNPIHMHSWTKRHLQRYLLTARSSLIHIPLQSHGFNIQGHTHICIALQPQTHIALAIPTQNTYVKLLASNRHACMHEIHPAVTTGLNVMAPIFNTTPHLAVWQSPDLW